MLAFLLLLAILGVHGISHEAQVELAKTIEKQPNVDPYTHLKAKTQRLWQGDSGKLINETIRQFLDIPVVLTVEVRLVGFDGHGFKNIKIPDVELKMYLGTLKAEMDSVVIYPELGASPVYPYFDWVVTHDTRGMAGRIEAALKQEAAHEHIESHGPGHEEMRPTPHAISHLAVDNIISQDTRNNNAHMTVYILNLNAGIGKYAYRYAEVSEDHPDCVGSHYVSAARGPGSRYLWWDITAGPVTYGPGSRHKGHVFEHSLPHPANFKPEALPNALSPHLAATAWSAVQHLVWPPMQHSQVRYHKYVLIQIIHIHERMTHTNDRFNYHVLESSLQSMLEGQQVIEIHETWLPMSSCPMCIEAYTSSLKVRTGRDESGTMLTAQTSRVLHAGTLHRLMTRYKDGVFGYAGVSVEPDSEDHRVLPVFIWDVRSATSEPVLFSTGQQAVSYPDMVLAVTSQAGVFSTPATCGYTNMMADSHEVTRAVLSSVLESGWGLANVSTYYTPATGLGHNHMWAVSSTPWGYLSSATSVSAPIAHVLARNLVLAHLNETATRMVTLLTGFASMSRNGKFDLYSAGEQKDRVVTRVNIAAYKLQRVVQMMQQGDYWKALVYARSMEYDTTALSKLALRVAKSTRTFLHCEAGATLTSVWWAPVSAVGMWAVAALLRKRVYRNKFSKDA